MLNKLGKAGLFWFLLVFGAIIFILSPKCTEDYSPSRVRLLVVIVADQFSYEYLERFGPLYTGGLKRLIEEGVSFKNAYHEHAETATCPGHASLVTGTHPSRSGIISNSWIDRKTGENVYCVEDKKYEKYLRSPRNLLVTGLGDWVGKNNQQAKVYAVSAKDRAAILLGGKKPDGVFWYNKIKGTFETNQFYYRSPPQWLKTFNKNGFLNRYFSVGWHRFRVDSDAEKEAGIVNLDEGVFSNDFPHPLGGLAFVPTEQFYEDIYHSPYVDAYLAAFTKELIGRESLGEDDVLDYLGLSFSALDMVGHGYGPHSPEVLDTVLHLDRILGDLFDFLDKSIGSEYLLIAFSSDHGVQPFPEYLQSINESGYRHSVRDVACVQVAGMKVREHFQNLPIFKGNFYLDQDVLRENGISVKDVDEQVRLQLSKCYVIKRVWTRAELLASSDKSIPYLTTLRKNFHPERSGDYFLQMKKNHLRTLRKGTGHGTPYPYDSHVPIMLLSQGMKFQKVTERVATVDLAPTLARLLNLRHPEDLDGKDRSGLIEKGDPTRPQRSRK
jgi:predicted AlkP superfamily pyrophosphatase or phosphodiesterase